MTRDSSDHLHHEFRAPRLHGPAAFGMLGRAHRDAARHRMTYAGKPNLTMSPVRRPGLSSLVTLIAAIALLVPGI